MEQAKIENFINHLQQTFKEWETNREYENQRNVENATFLFKEIFNNELLGGRKE